MARALTPCNFHMIFSEIPNRQMNINRILGYNKITYCSYSCIHIFGYIYFIFHIFSA